MDNQERFKATQELREEYDKRGYEIVELVGRQDFLQRVDPKHISALERELRQTLGKNIQEWKKNFEKDEAPEILAYHMGANNNKVNNLELLKILEIEEGVKPRELDWLNQNNEIPVEIYFFEDGEIKSSYNISVG